MLVTGATGYIGGRLVPKLVSRGHDVRVMVRGGCPECDPRWPGAAVVSGDALVPESLPRALEGVHTAFYLIHSLLLGPEGFATADIAAAVNFRRAAEQAGVSRIIYLGGLGDARARLSDHLQNRSEVAEALAAGSIPVTVLRAAIIIGAGSASYEIIKHLVNRLPVFLVPDWAKTRCQPIAVGDVVRYLVGVLESPSTAGRSYDIGGRDVLTYEAMLLTMAELLNRRRICLRSSFNRLGPYAYLASLLTPVPAPIIRCLMESLRNEVVCQHDSIADTIPFRPLGFREAVVQALSREEQDRVRTRWAEAYPPAHELALKLHEVGGSPTYHSRYELETDRPADSLFRAVCSVGGKEGWFHNNWMWRLRGGVDRLLLGVGSTRGRRSRVELHVNDVVDFWRVEDLVANRRLLLRAEMKLPGKAWLEFGIDEVERAKRRLSIDAHYITRGALGHAYWYVFLPFHHFIFTDLLRQLEARS